MSQALAACGPDAAGLWLDESVGLAHRLMCFTPEDRFEKQPLSSADGRRRLVFDGRIDNRRELAQVLAISPADARELPDSALFLRAFERFGDECVRHVVGAF